MEIVAWLRDLGLDQYVATFRENAVDLDVVRELTADDLKDMGITAVGHRRKLLFAIAQLSAERASGTETVTPAMASRQPEGEHRHVAVLFADLVGYTELTHELGAEGTHALLDSFFSRVDAVVERAGGRVDKHIGDCVMGVFGAPVAHGNDAERALRAALGAAAAVETMSAEHGREIGVHIGVTTGTVVASYLGTGAATEYAVTGASVNLASRLADAAGPGEVLISNGLYRELEDRLVCEPVGEFAVKGLAEPVQAWRLVRLREDRSQRGRFIGRRGEVRQFQSILAACRADGFGQTVHIRGDAGIGKTRLCEEFERLARESGFLCHRGLVLDFGAETGRDAVRTIVRELLDVDPRAEHEALQRATEDVLARRVIDSDMQVHLNDLLNLPQPGALRALYDAMDNERRQQGRGATLSHLIRWAAGHRPRLLFVEDAHWAKGPLLRSLAEMARTVADCPAVLLVTSRIERDPLDRTWRAMIAGTPFTTIDLSPFRLEEAREFCEAAAGVDPTLIHSCIARSAGNPLFLEQLLRYARVDGGSGVPGTIRSLIQARIDQLSPADKKAVQAASVVGQRVDPELLAVLCGDAGKGPVHLVEQNLLRPLGQDYLFVHALIRDVVYNSLLTPTRADLHQRTAGWFADRDPTLHAEHLALASAPGAAAAFLKAARAEIAKYHYETALGLIERGLGLTGTPEDRFALQLLLGETLYDLGRMAEASAAYRAALDFAEAAPDRCRALIGLAGVKRVTEDLDGARANLDRAELEAVAEDLAAEQSRIHFMRGNLLFPRGDLDGCLRAHETALAFARKAGRPDLEAAALGGLGDAEYVRGRMASARDRLEECVRLARQQGLGRIEVANQAQIAHTLVYTAAQQDAYEFACAAAEAAARVGHMRAEINARAATVKALFGLAHYETCLAEIEILEDLIARLGTVRFRQNCYLFGGRALHGLGRTEEAAAMLRKGLEFARETGFGFHGPPIASALALIGWDRAQRLAALDEAEAGIMAGCVGHNQFRVYADGIDVAFELADPGMMRRYVGLLDDYPPGETVAWSAFHAERGRALLTWLEAGDTPEVKAALDDIACRSEALTIRYCRSVAGELGLTRPI